MTFFVDYQRLTMCRMGKNHVTSISCKIFHQIRKGRLFHVFFLRPVTAVFAPFGRCVLERTCFWWFTNRVYLRIPQCFAIFPYFSPSKKKHCDEDLGFPRAFTSPSLWLQEWTRWNLSTLDELQEPFDAFQGGWVDRPTDLAVIYTNIWGRSRKAAGLGWE